MTCKDCKHFYERKPKPWRTDKDLGYCDHSREGKIEVNRNCPVNKWCDDKFVYNDGTYHDGNWHCPRCGTIVSKCGLCMDCEILFGSWENVSK